MALVALNTIFLMIKLCSYSGEEEPPTSTLKKKAEEEKKQHEHLLQLNQLLAKQVMEKSKIVAGKTNFLLFSL